MTSQLDRDWEEQQHGLQGTVTGSAHNQIGLDSRMPPVDAPSNDRGRANRETQAATSAGTAPQAAASQDFSVPVAILGFIGVCYWLHEPAQESPWPMLIGAGLGGALAGRFYKPIVALTLVLGAFFAYDYFTG